MWVRGLKWMCLILGTVIGAGYASGREIWQFFSNDHGVALLLFPFLFFICCAVIMMISYKNQTNDYVPLLQILVGRHLALLYDIFIVIYLFTTSIVMLAGGGAAVKQFGVPYIQGVIFMGLLLVFMFLFQLKAFLSLNVVLMPFLIISLIAILFTAVDDWQMIQVTYTQTGFQALLFLSFNILSLVGVIGTVGYQIKRKGEIFIAAFGSSLILGMVTFFYHFSMKQSSVNIERYDIPLYAILDRNAETFAPFIFCLLWIAIFTTAASNIASLAARMKTRWQAPLWKIALVMIVFMFPFTMIGFKQLIAFLYPLYGAINLFLCLSIIAYPFYKRRR